ncbi:hypothetical protein M758_12G178200 [Ceratodon purpureus]|nr:hypothetical protein M758_12G178200 [Ceratodon purpureus]
MPDTVITTTITNGSGSTLEIYKGSGGIYAKLGKLERDKIFPIKTDVNATYREYKISSIKEKNLSLYISSDDLMQYSEIKVSEDSWTGTPRTEVSVKDEKISPFRWILNKLRFR